MRVIAATSSAAAQGSTTDAGATVGEVTVGGTGFLILLGALIGVGGGVIYLVARRWLPSSGWRRGLVFGAFLTSLAGPVLIEPEGIDFTILSPVTLAVAMFLAIPLGYGLMFVPLIERVEPRLISTHSKAAFALMGLTFLPLTLGFIPGAMVLAVALVIFGLRRLTGLEEVWNGRAVEIGGYGLLGALTLFGLSALITDLAHIY